jgi:uncharacterized RDD family membrane protein YckC
MTGATAAANWYPDPAGSGGLRYWDGAAWTEHWAPPPPPYASWGVPPWKGAQLGLPADGPGALANPGRRLAARLLDGLLLIPVFALLLSVTLLIAAPHFGPIFGAFPRSENTTNAMSAPPGILWVYVTVIACVLTTGIVMVAYETVATARYGRTLGKAWLHIRPVRTDGSRLTWGRSFGRIAIYWASGFVSWLGLLDPLWCLWDANAQCLHDKAVGSIVINDPAP